MIKHTYHLLGEVTSHDFDALRRAKVDHVIITDDYPIDIDALHSNFRIMRNQDVQITITSSEQEMWLKLCFGDRLIHFSTHYDID